MLLNICGFNFILSYILMMHKDEAEVRIRSVDEKDLVQFRTSDIKVSGFRLVNKHEIKYKNQMYDIVKIENTGDDKVYYCVNDYKEDEINKQINEINNSDTFKSKSLLKNIIKNLNRDYIKSYSIFIR